MNMITTIITTIALIVVCIIISILGCFAALLAVVLVFGTEIGRAIVGTICTWLLCVFIIGSSIRLCFPNLDTDVVTVGEKTASVKPLPLKFVPKG